MSQGLVTPATSRGHGESPARAAREQAHAMRVQSQIEAGWSDDRESLRKTGPRAAYFEGSRYSSHEPSICVATFAVAAASDAKTTADVGPQSSSSMYSWL